MATKAQIRAAVEALAKDEDASWTASGLPNVDAVSSALGERVTREDISGASDRTREPGGQTVAGRGDPNAPSRAPKMEGDPKEPAPGGAVDRDPKTGGLVDSTGETQIRAASTARNYVPSKEGIEPEALFDLMEQVCTAAASNRYRRNQVLGQIRLLWANEGKTARDAQNKMEGRIERREEKRAVREERAVENA